MQRLLSIAVFAVLHFVLSFASLFVGGGFIMAAFDGKGSALLARAAGFIINVLIFPMSAVAGLIPGGLRGVGTVGEYAILVANSLIWGVAVGSVWTWWRRRRVAAVGA